MKSFSIIVAHDTNRGIGKDNLIPWTCSEDRKYFHQQTIGAIVIMGRRTWESIGHALLDRRNIVLSSQPVNNCESYRSLHECLIKIKDESAPAYIIGGAALYNQAIKLNACTAIYTTLIHGYFACDKYFPIVQERFYKVDFTIYTNKCAYTKYIRHCKNEPEHTTSEAQYLLSVADILNNGVVRIGRNGETKSIFGSINHCFDLSAGFPMLTTKKMPFYTIVKELLFFLHGKTDAKILARQNVRIWNDNTSRQFLNLRNLSHYQDGDMGPMYGWNWRHFNAKYTGCDTDYLGSGHDQLAELINTIKTDPSSRRLLLTTYDPSKVAESVLPPCHGLTVQFSVYNNELSCKMYQRSADIMLGYPFNIASYALLTHIIAQACGLTPGKLYISLGDAHIYAEHYELAALQISRDTLPLPTLTITKANDPQQLSPLQWIESLQSHNFSLDNYISFDAIKFEMKA